MRHTLIRTQSRKKDLNSLRPHRYGAYQYAGRKRKATVCLTVEKMTDLRGLSVNDWDGKDTERALEQRRPVIC
jgi:hypothetical protein